MQTHDDGDATFFERPFSEELKARAEKMRKQKQSEIAGGKEGEEELARWQAHGIQVVVRPDDPQDILRISVGGMSHGPRVLNYCTIRGDIGACISLLERAVAALKNAP